MREVYQCTYLDGAFQAKALRVLPQSKHPGLLLEHTWLNGGKAWAELSVDDMLNVIEDILPLTLMSSTGEICEIGVPYAVIADALSFLQEIGAFSLT